MRNFFMITAIAAVVSSGSVAGEWKPFFELDRNSNRQVLVAIKFEDGSRLEWHYSVGQWKTYYTNTYVKTDHSEPDATATYRLEIEKSKPHWEGDNAVFVLQSWYSEISPPSQ